MYVLPMKMGFLLNEVTVPFVFIRDIRINVRTDFKNINDFLGISNMKKSNTLLSHSPEYLPISQHN